MAETFYTILTLIGKAKLANAIPLQDPVDLATMKVGDSGGAYRNPAETDEDVVGEVWSGPINAIYVDPDNANYLIIEAVIQAQIGPFYVREVGIFDDAGDMIAIGKFPETYKPQLEEGAGKDLYLRFIMEVSNTSAVTLKINPALVLATRQYADDQHKASVTYVDTVADLRLLGPTNLSKSVQVRGYYAVGDGGGGPLRIWMDGAAPGSYIDNGGSIIVPTGGDGSGAWVWYSARHVVTVMDYDATGDNVSDDTSAFTRAIATTKIFGGTVSVPAAVSCYKTTGNIDIPNGVILEGVGIPTQKNYALYGPGNPTCSIIKPTGDVSRAISLRSTRGSAVLNLIIDMSGVTAAGTGAIIGITQAYPAVVAVDAPHNKLTGDVFAITDVVGMTEVNGKRFVINVLDDTHFELRGVDSSGYSAYVSGGVWTLNPVGLIVDGAWHFDVRNNIVINLPNNNCIGILFIASEQGSYWGAGGNLQVYSQSGVGKGFLFQGIKPSIGGVGNPRVNQLVLPGLRAVNVYDGLTCDECGGGLVFQSLTCEANANDGVVVTNNSTSGYPTIIGGELNTNGGFGANGLVELINSVSAAGNMGGTGIASADYWLTNGAYSSRLDSSGRKVNSGPFKAKTFIGENSSQMTVAAGDTISSAFDTLLIGSSGGEIALTSNPQISPGYRGQKLTLIGSSNTNFLTFNNGNGVSLTSDFLSIKEGDTANFVYFDNVGISEINNKWVQVPFVVGGLNYAIQEINADVALKSHHHFIFMTTGGVNKNATLPLLSSVPGGKPIVLYNVDGLNTCTLLAGAGTINGAASYVVPAIANSFVEVIKTSLEWKIIRSS